MNIENTNENKCKEKQARKQREERLIIDYVITSKECVETIKSIKIDGKQYAVYKVEHLNKPIEKRYSDHNATSIKIDFISPENVERKNKFIVRKRCKKYQKIIQRTIRHGQMKQKTL